MGKSPIHGSPVEVFSSCLCCCVVDDRNPMVGARVRQCTITKPFPPPRWTLLLLLGNLLTQAQRSHVADVGQSMISELVCSKAAEVMDDIHGLLEKDAFVAPDKWGRAWHLIAEPVHMDGAKVLMLTLVHQMAAEWQMRSVSVVSKFPLKFMVCLETAHHADCSMRREVAEMLLNSCDEMR
jgi:hypothetical protein